SNDGINATSTTSVDDFTISTWFKADATDGWRAVVSIGENRDLTLLNDYLVFDNGGSTQNFGLSAPISTGTWYYATITASGNNLVLYLNSVQKPSGSLSLGPYTGRIAVGYWPSEFGADHFNGIIDEVRVSNIVRSSDWIATEYNNQLNPSNYLVTASEEQFINIFGYRKPILINSNQISGSINMTNFPIYMDYFDSDIKTKAQSTGADLFFADINGSRLVYELIEFNQNYNGSHAHIKTWVRINSINPLSDTKIYLYYGQSEIIGLQSDIGVGTGSFEAIYHLDEDAVDGQVNTIHNDSASANHGNQNGNNNVSGIIDSAQYFDGTSDQIIVNSSLGLEPSGDVTISGWFKLDSTFDGTSTSNVLLTRQLTSSNNIHFALVGTDYSRSSNVGLNNMPNGAMVVKIELGGPDTWHWTNRTTWTAGVWYHFAYIIDTDGASNNRIFINGVDDTDIPDMVVEDESESINYAADWEIGGGTVDTSQLSGGTRYFTGSLDEIRIIDGVMTSGWIQTEYNSIYDPQNMYTIGSEERNFPYLQNFGVYDPGNGFPQYWANITGSWQGSINSATIEVDSSPFSMSYNGTYWVYAPAGVVFNTTYSYQIVNATDILGQYLPTTSTIESYTSDKDVIDPTIDGTPQYDGSNLNDGVFGVNASDGWGNIDSVLLTILDHSDPATCGGSCYSTTNAIMQYNSIEFVNDSISLFKGTLTYQIVVNDTVGNTYISGNQTANVLN
ncbi:MAG: LamG-like jellyroll fold domain-containing protein, partial [Candidatus Kariarchaeaceae archaeon]